MPEIKRIPQEGKMNIDLHERILPAGQYREALNVNVGRSETSEVGTVENLLGNRLVGDTGLVLVGDEAARCIGSYRDNGRERIFFFVTTNDSFDQSPGGQHGVYQYDQTSGQLTQLVSSDVLNFHKDFIITGINLIDDLLFWTDDRNEPRKINIDRARNNPDHYSSNVLLSVAKPAPFTAATIVAAVNDPTISSTFLSDRLPRFTYRWRFDDGEYSVLAPFTPIVFNTNVSSVPRAAEGDEAIITGAVDAFTNNINSITLTAPVTTNAGITSIEFIYSDTSNSNAYILDDVPVTSESSIGFTYQSQDPFRTLPANQITRVFDAVPRRAKAQEVAGGRIVYGNYLQNYNLPTVDFSVSSSVIAGNSQLPNQHVKSNRTYEVGIVLSDESGRTTPVILSNSGEGTRFVSSTGEKLTINFSDTAQLDGFHSYKVVVKQRQQEYYNLFTFEGSRNGDNASKVPIDLTEGVPEGSQSRPSSRSVYVGDVLTKVAINTAGAIVSPTLTGVFEVEPFESDIDIFWESSTGDLISQIPQATDILVDYYNCYIIDGIEANRIRMGFNDPAWDFGVRAHAVNEEFAGEERRSNAMIHSSGFFNSRTGLNQLNQFNEGEGGITLSLDPSDGSIQKLYAEDTQLIIWQEDKVSRSPIDKDFIYSAEGGAVPVTSNTQYLGTIAPYAGEYGISTDPGSFSVYGTRKYFTDRNRGVVLRLSQDGLTEISRYGLSDFFRDALRDSTSIIGSYNEYHNVYNLTISGDGYASNEDTNKATASDGYFTVGFEEDVQGWVSFKSFQQNSGTTLNNRYYTFNGGNLWEHNDPAEGRRNNFYDNGPAPSYIDFILNDGPSNVKTFHTIGYEGTEGWECDYIQTEIGEIGDPPVVTEGFVNSTLMVDSSSAENTRFTGERTNVVLGGEETQWVLQVSPISPQYVLDDLDQVDLTIETPGVLVMNKTLNDGSIYFLIEAVDAQEFIYRVSLAGNGSRLAFQATLLTINITGTSVSDPNIELSRVSIALNDAGELVTEGVEVSGLGDYYIEDSVMVDFSSISSLVSGITITESGADDFTVSIPVQVPEDPTGTFPVIIDATSLLKPNLTWQIPSAGIIGYETPITSSPVVEAIPLSPRDLDSARTNNVTLDITSGTEGTHFIADDDITLVDGDVVNGTVSVPVAISADRSSVSFSALSDIDDVDLTTTINVTADTTEATLVIPDTTDIATDYLGITVSRAFTSNVDIGSTFGTIDIVDSEIDFVIPEILDGDLGTGVNEDAIISPVISRLVGLDQTITISQTARYFDTPDAGNVDIVQGTAGSYRTTISYPSTFTDVIDDTSFTVPAGITTLTVTPVSGVVYNTVMVLFDVNNTVLAGDHLVTIDLESATYIITITVVP